MIKAVIFDMDGVIIDSEMGYLEDIWAFAKKKNPDVKLSELYGMVGSSREDSWSVCAAAIHNGQTWDEIRDEYRGSVDIFSTIDYRRIFRPEITGILKQLKADGYRLALASSTQLSVVLRVLTENEIREFFEVVVSGEQFKRSKPDPEIYHHTAALLGVREEECLVIEDSTFGVTAAHVAGMKIVALRDDRFNFDQSLADIQIESMHDFLQAVKKLTGQ